MKKEAVSVLKPRNGKKTSDKVRNVFKKKEKKIIPSIESHVTKLKVVSVENLNIGNNLKRFTNIKQESVDRAEWSSLQTNVKNGQTKRPKNDTAVEGKMATIRKVRENEPRGQPKKKPKIRLNDESRMAIECEKRVKSKMESAKECKKVKSEIWKKPTRGREKEKPKIHVVEEPLSEAMERKNGDESNIQPAKEINEVITPILKNPQHRAGRKTNIGSGHLKLSREHIFNSIKAIKKLQQKELESKKSLLPTENIPVYLQVTCVKVPKTPRRQIRPSLPHPVIGPLDDVAIFVPDLESGRKKDYEKTVDHWETAFRKLGIDSIKQVIPMNQIKTEYNQYEMIRKLASSFDYFLTDSRISGHLTHLLGKGFYRRQNAPTPVRLTHDDLAQQLNRALHKTCMEIHSYGNTHVVKVGSVSMKTAKLAQNIWTVCETLAEQYPGGWPNVRAIRIKAQTGRAIPIYLTLTSKNAIPVPVVKPKRPRAYETVEGELTTLPGLTTVTVTPEGKVTLKRTRDPEDYKDSAEVKKEDSEDEEENEEVAGDDEENDD